MSVSLAWRAATASRAFPKPEAGIAIACACHEVLMRGGLAAKLAVERGLPTTNRTRERLEDYLKVRELLAPLSRRLAARQKGERRS